MNKIFLSGNLTRDPETKTYKGDITTAKIRRAEYQRKYRETHKGEVQNVD